MPIRITGMNSGLDTEAIISALVSSYNYKTDKYKKAQTKLSWKQDAWKTLNTKIYSLYNSVGNLRFSTAYNLKSTKVSDTTKATVTASSNAPTGTQKLKITQIAQAGYLTGGKLNNNTTGSTTLAELGYTGGDGKIDLTMGDGTKKEIEVTQGTTVNSFIASLKEAGVSANYDETNKRIFISSKSTGKDNDFTLTGANVDGANALHSLKLNVSSDATTATYKSYAKYLYNGYNYDIKSGTETADLTQNIKDAITAYQAAKKDYDKASAENGNLTAAYGYASAYSSMRDALKASGLSEADQAKLQTLLGMSASERVDSVMDAAGHVYTKSGSDEAGNAIYSYNDGTTTKYIQSVITYADATDSNKTYTANDDGTLTYDGKKYTSTGKTDEDKNVIYKDDDGNEVSIKTTTEYYEATASEEGTGLYKITDADGNTYIEKEKGVYYGSDGKKYKLDENKENVLQEIDDAGEVVEGNTVTVNKNEEIKKTTYVRGKKAADANRSADVLTDLKEKENFKLTDEEVSTLTSNIASVNAFKAVKDTVLDGTSKYTRGKIVSEIETAYNSAQAGKGSEGVKAYTANFAEYIKNNSNDMETAEATMEKHQVLADIAEMEPEKIDAAIGEFEKQVRSASEILPLLESDDFKEEGAKKIDGTDSRILLNDIEYTSDKNTFSINGLSITAQQITGEDDKDAITISTSTDTQGIYDKIKDFLTQYNSLINEITSLYNADSAKGYDPLTDDEKDAMSDSEIEKWEEKIKSSLLRRDDSLSSVMNAMTSSMSKGIEIGGKTYYLSSFGIRTLGYFDSPKNEQYAYHIDGDEDDTATSGNTDKLMAAIASDPDTVMEFMQKLCTNLYTDIGDKMKATSLSSTYTVYNDKEMASEYSDYTSLIKKWEEKLQSQEDYWYNKFSAMETALAKLNSQTSSLTGMLG